MALRRELAIQERTAIDAAFSAMAEDAAYRAEAEAIDEASSQADWDAIRDGERQYAGGDDAAR